MKGDIALLGFLLTAEEWQALDLASRTEMLAAAYTKRDTARVRVPQLAAGSRPVRRDK